VFCSFIFARVEPQGVQPPAAGLPGCCYTQSAAGGSTREFYEGVQQRIACVEPQGEKLLSACLAAATHKVLLEETPMISMRV
jgi:hypothetical protein